MLLALRFAFSILWQAIVLSVSWMGTSLLSVLVKIIIVPCAIFAMQLIRQGRKAVWNRIRENVKDTAIATSVVWILIISINVFFTVPHRIILAANAVVVPPRPVPTPPPTAMAPVRSTAHQNSTNEMPSYLAFDGESRFPMVPLGGQAVEERNFRVGDFLAFNIFYKQIGPNPVEMIESSFVVYTAGDHESATQEGLIADFEKRIREGRLHLPPRDNRPTLMPGDHRFFSAFSPTATNARSVITQSDLDRMDSGEELVFVIVQLIYRDTVRTHHLRRFEWLQPPAVLPGIWHPCDRFNNSD